MGNILHDLYTYKLYYTPANRQISTIIYEASEQYKKTPTFRNGRGRFYQLAIRSEIRSRIVSTEQL